MEMEMEVTAEAGFDALVARLTAATSVLEGLAERGIEIEGRGDSREAELERMLAEAEATIASLRAGRKTQAGGSLVAKEGVGLDAGSLDAALVSLSVEQRIAVKSQLLRSGLMG